MAEPHAHELDGKLHPDTCPMCALIADRYELARRERLRDSHMANMAKRVWRSHELARLKRGSR